VSVTSHVTESELRALEIERLANSHTLHGSESLCKLLRYLAGYELRHPGLAPKEYQVATEVFGRPSDFDPHLDSLVRVQAGRLRSKLAEYYAGEGAEDSIVVELQKGCYALAFHHVTTTPKAVLYSADEKEPQPKVERSRRPYLALIQASVLLVLVAVAVGALVLTRNITPSSFPAVKTSPAFLVFWHPFITASEDPWIIFSNGAFVGRPESGLRYFDPRRDSREAILDHYTGVGEVLAVYDLDHTFAQLHKGIRVKRGSLFSLDDAQTNNLIFVGSPAENLTLLDIPSTHEFVFQRPTSGPRRNDLALVNVHPLADEPKMFFSSPPGTQLMEDYAVISLGPGMNPAHWVLILAGTTTIGTQAAAEYVCRQESLEQLLLRLSVSDNGEMKPFEAVLRVKIARGVPVGSELIALRKVAQ